jgi:hypothetical protein
VVVVGSTGRTMETTALAKKRKNISVVPEKFCTVHER